MFLNSGLFGLWLIKVKDPPALGINVHFPLNAVRPFSSIWHMADLGAAITILLCAKILIPIKSTAIFVFNFIPFADEF